MVRFGKILPALALAAVCGCATPDAPVMRERDINAICAAQVMDKCSYAGSDGYVLNYRLHAPRAKFLRRYPLVLFLHGSGERGSDNEKTLKHAATPLCRYALKHGDAFVLVPQCPDGEKWSDADWSRSSMTRTEKPTRVMTAVLDLVDDLAKRYPVDRSRIYVTGLSMGGFGSWDAASRRPDLFAAVMPICGGVDEHTAALYSGMNLRFFHGSDDPAVSVEYSRRMHKALDAAGVKHTYIEYPGVQHDCWTRTYADDRMLSWMFGCR